MNDIMQKYQHLNFVVLAVTAFMLRALNGLAREIDSINKTSVAAQARLLGTSPAADVAP